MADSDENLTEEQKQLYRKSRVPSKFCAYCGTKNNAEADRCASCGKDISWMRVPEPIPHDQAPPQAPRSLPKQDKVFTPKTVLVIALVLGLVLAFILILVLVTGGESAEMAPADRKSVV